MLRIDTPTTLIGEELRRVEAVEAAIAAYAERWMVEVSVSLCQIGGEAILTVRGRRGIVASDSNLLRLAKEAKQAIDREVIARAAARTGRAADQARFNSDLADVFKS